MTVRDLIIRVLSGAGKLPVQAGAGFNAGHIAAPQSTTTSIMLTATAPYGGHPPYTYQWYRSTAPDWGLGTSTFMPPKASVLVDGAGIQGSEALSLVDESGMLTAHTMFYYTLVATDAQNQQVVYKPQGAMLWLPPIIILYISDSIHTHKQLGNTVVPAEGCFPNLNTCDSVPTLMGAFLGVIDGLRSVTLVNQSCGGSTSEDWRPDNAATGFFTTALHALKDAMAANPVAKVYAVIVHGTNDCHPAGARPSLTVERHVQNLQAMIQSLTAAGCTGVTIGSSPSFQYSDGYFFEGSSHAHIPLGPAQKALLVAYRAAERGLANGKTVKTGDGVALELFEQRPALLYDGVHLTDDGIKLYALLDARAFYDNWLK